MDITQVSVILALLLSIFNLWDKIETRVRQSKEPTKQLENRLATIEKVLNEDYAQKFKSYDAHFDNDLRRIEEIERGNRVTQQAILALLKHAIDGNEISALKEASDALTKYLINR